MKSGTPIAISLSELKIKLFNNTLRERGTITSLKRSAHLSQREKKGVIKQTAASKTSLAAKQHNNMFF